MQTKDDISESCIYDNCTRRDLTYHADKIILPDNTVEYLYYFICGEHSRSL